MNNVLLIMISILPVILIGTYIYQKDYNKEPAGILVKLFLGGVLSIAMVLIVTIGVNLIFPSLRSDHILTAGFISKFVKIFFGVAIIEEGCKWIIAHSFSYNSKYFDEYYDIILYCAFVALGFAAAENIMYVLTSGFKTGILRMFTAVPAHCFFGIIMGEYLGLAKIAEFNGNISLKNKNILLSIFLPSLFHCIYDYLAFLGNILAVILLIVAIILGYVVAIKKVKKFSSLTRPNYYPNNNYVQYNVNNYSINYCPRCGSKLNACYCHNCQKYIK